MQNKINQMVYFILDIFLDILLDIFIRKSIFSPFIDWYYLSLNKY